MSQTATVGHGVMGAGGLSVPPDTYWPEVMAEVLFGTSGQLHEFVSGHLREVPGVERVEALIVLERAKESHDWGVPAREGDER